MAYKTEDLKKRALAAIKKHKLTFHSHVIAHIAIAESTYNQHGLNKDEDIETALLIHKVDTKKLIRDKMLESSSSSSHIFMYRLLSSQDERDVLDSASAKAIPDELDNFNIVINKTYEVKDEVDTDDNTDA